MNPVKVSVLLPFYNPGSYFREAIESVLNQDFSEFELLLIDNNSDAASVKIALEYQAIDERVKLLHELQQGISFALNAGLRTAKGNLIARMDADDVCLPGRLKLQYEYMQNYPEAGMIAGLVKPFMNEINEGMLHFIQQNNSLLNPEQIFHHRFLETPFIHPTVMFRKSLVDEYGYYSTEAIPEDYELWLRWFSKGIRIQKLPVEVIVWRDHSGRLTRMHKNYSREAFRKIRMKYLADWIRHQPGLPPIHIWGGGKYSRQSATILKESGIEISGFIDVNPNRKIKDYSVMHFSDIPEQGSIFIISMISNRDKFLEVRKFLSERNYCEGTDYILSG